jgi:tetratricopeptide (TPR) repeat protein
MYKFLVFTIIFLSYNLQHTECVAQKNYTGSTTFKDYEIKSESGDLTLILKSLTISWEMSPPPPGLMDVGSINTTISFQHYDYITYKGKQIKFSQLENSVNKDALKYTIEYEILSGNSLLKRINGVTSLSYAYIGKGFDKANKIIEDSDIGLDYSKKEDREKFQKYKAHGFRMQIRSTNITFAYMLGSLTEDRIKRILESDKESKRIVLNKEKAKSLKKSGDSYYRANSFETALSKYKEAAKLDPKNYTYTSLIKRTQSRIFQKTSSSNGSPSQTSNLNPSSSNTSSTQRNTQPSNVNRSTNNSGINPTNKSDARVARDKKQREAVEELGESINNFANEMASHLEAKRKREEAQKQRIEEENRKSAAIERKRKQDKFNRLRDQALNNIRGNQQIVRSYNQERIDTLQSYYRGIGIPSIEGKPIKSRVIDVDDLTIYSELSTSYDDVIMDDRFPITIDSQNILIISNVDAINRVREIENIAQTLPQLIDSSVTNNNTQLSHLNPNGLNTMEL